MIDFHTHIFPDHVADKSLPHLAEVCREEPNTNGKKDGSRCASIGFFEYLRREKDKKSQKQKTLD